MSYNLFLDDIRNPIDCYNYMGFRAPDDIDLYMGEWVIARHFNEFVKILQEKGNPVIISFDHDLDFTHYQDTPAGNTIYDDRTGYHCASAYKSMCWQNDWEYAQIIVHSMNPVGTERIQSLFK